MDRPRGMDLVILSVVGAGPPFNIGPLSIMPPTAPSWQFSIAYALLAAPLVYIAFAGGPYPVPRDLAVKFYALIGFACGAGVFIVRRRHRDVIGWIGLIGWGGLSMLAVIYALLR